MVETLFFYQLIEGSLWPNGRGTWLWDLRAVGSNPRRNLQVVFDPDCHKKSNKYYQHGLKLCLLMNFARRTVKTNKEQFPLHLNEFK